MNDFINMLCKLYIIFLTAALPLYTGGTYWKLGDTKYAMFRNVTLSCLGAWLAVSVIRGIISLAGGKRRFPRLSIMDLCMLAYGGAVLVSALCSPYAKTPWTGYTEWYMGAVSQCMFVGIYFFISRSCDGSRVPVYVGEAALAVVFLIGLAHRLGFDPIGVMQPFHEKSWEYSHMISTIGNINWFCGFCSVMLGFPAAFFLKSKGKPELLLHYTVSIMGLVLLCIQGSDAGPLIAAVCIGVSLLYGLKDKKIFQRGLALASGMCLVMAAYAKIVRSLGTAAMATVPLDGIGLDRIAWNGWWVVGAVFLILAVVIGKSSQGTAKKAGAAMMLAGGLAVMALAVAYALRMPGGDGWGSGRGGLWRFAWQGFVQGGFRQKLVGAGPDCFAEYIYSTLPASQLTPTEGFWTGTIYANAHNEWLNALVDMGILGTAALAGIYISCVKRYRKLTLGMLVIAMYGVNSLISFQQVLSTPLLFMVLGMCEYHMRNRLHVSREGSDPMNEKMEQERNTTI
ncbi:MAG: O-antigen ligase family protein [Lachnospiraceae bacterium]|nr:O-antigen ligase family protein [Lachnospiraceae bacterium]